MLCIPVNVILSTVRSRRFNDRFPSVHKNCEKRNESQYE